VDHTHACETHAVERYLLGELLADDAEDFERHYFECRECEAAVEAGGLFIANTRAVFAEEKPRAAEKPSLEPLPRTGSQPPRKTFLDALAALWRQPAFGLTAAAAILFGSIALYQGAVLIPNARGGADSARALPAFLLNSAARGETTPVTVPAGTVSFALAVDLPPGAQFPKYLCTLSEGGRTVFGITSPPPRSGQPITILAPVKGLRAGNAELTVSGLRADGKQPEKVDSWSFSFQLEDLQFKP